jgi:hypothetical protein
MEQPFCQQILTLCSPRVAWSCPEDAEDAVRAMSKADRLGRKNYVASHHKADAAGYLARTA